MAYKDCKGHEITHGDIVRFRGHDYTVVSFLDGKGRTGSAAIEFEREPFVSEVPDELSVEFVRKGELGENRSRDERPDSKPSNDVFDRKRLPWFERRERRNEDLQAQAAAKASAGKSMPPPTRDSLSQALSEGLSPSANDELDRKIGELDEARVHERPGAVVTGTKHAITQPITQPTPLQRFGIPVEAKGDHMIMRAGAMALALHDIQVLLYRGTDGKWDAGFYKKTYDEAELLDRINGVMAAHGFRPVDDK
jgi:hypothetical protein